MFWGKIRKACIRCKPEFYYIKVGCKRGYALHGHISMTIANLMHHSYTNSYRRALCECHQHHTCKYIATGKLYADGGRLRIQLQSELYTYEAVCAHAVPIKLSQFYTTLCSVYSSVVCNVPISCTWVIQ